MAVNERQEPTGHGHAAFARGILHRFSPEHTRPLSWLLLAGLLSGCTTMHAARDYAGPEPLPQSIIEAFTYPRAAIDASNHVIKETRDYTIRRIEFTPAVNLAGEHTMVIDYYDLPGAEPAPAVLVLPILGGKNKIAHHFAAVFARNGFAAAIVHRQEQYKETDDLDEMNRVFKQIVLDHMQAVDWLESQPDVDAARLGLFGISAGGIKGSLVYALEKRLKAAVLALVGGDVAHILSYSSEKGIIKRRDKVLAEQGITVEEFHAAVKEGFEHDPLRYAPYADARHVLLVLALFDTVVPYQKGLELRDAMGGPRTVIIPTGHYTAVLYLPVLERMTVDFFRGEL